MEGSSFTPIRAEDANHRTTLRHLLSAESESKSPQFLPTTLQQPLSTRRDRDSPRADGVRTPKPPAAMTTTTRRNKGGNVSSVYSGNRISFLKKDDGEPLWRKDIQYLFLRTVFSDQRRVFTKASDGTTGHTFSEIYIDAMAKSSKCSQILKDKLLNDTSGAIDMAMICLLVNVGRMNTTLNFFPEMRARVRTYHSIPSLQAQQGVQAYKQLQDGPRLKSILKGATEDSHQPGTIEDIMSHAKPRTNPVNLIFVLSQYAPKISEMHFFPPRDFFDIFIRTTLSSRSRATAFLWMVWWYLESDFTPDDAVRNPFGRGQSGDDAGVPIKVPSFEILSEEEAALENVDTPEEIAFGRAKKLEREAILANDMPPTASAPKRGVKTPMMEQQHNYRFRVSPYGSSASGSEAGSRGRPSPSPPRDSRPEELTGHGGRVDRDATRSPPLVPSRGTNLSSGQDFTPVGPGGVRISNLLNEEQHATPSSSGSRNKGVGRGNYPRKPKEPTVQPFEQVHRHPELQPHPPHRHQTHGAAHDYPELQGASNISHLFSAPNARNPALLTPHNVAPATAMLEGFWMPLNGPGGDHQASVISAGQGPHTHGVGGKRARNPSAYQQAVERSRRQRLNYLLDRNMRTLQRVHSRQRKRRGALADAWIKCSAMASGWNSEDDEPLGRWAGIDIVRTTEGIERSDVGAKASEIARALRRIGRRMGAGVMIDRDRNLLRGKGRRGLWKQEEEMYANEDVPTPTPPRDLPSGFAEPGAEMPVVKEKKKKGPYKRKAAKLEKAKKDDDDVIMVGHTAPKERKKGVKRGHDGKAKAAAATESAAGPSKGRGGAAKARKAIVVVEDDNEDESDEGYVRTYVDELNDEMGPNEENPGPDDTPVGSPSWYEHYGEEEEGSEGKEEGNGEEDHEGEVDTVMVDA